jgi:hypothetical protein
LNTGKKVMLLGLSLQLICFTFFTAATMRFDFKSRKILEANEGTRPRWRFVLWGLYLSCLLILVRPPSPLWNTRVSTVIDGEHMW